MFKSMAEVTETLAAIEDGNPRAAEELLPLVYEELRKLAAARLAEEKPGQTLQPTALVHEAYMRLVDQRDVDWRNRAQFFGVAAQIMRRLLVDHARGRSAGKRDFGATRLSIDGVAEVAAGAEAAVDVEALDEALDRLAELDPRQSRVVELRYFGGLGVEETAEVLAVSTATVKREWAMARAWLKRRLAEGAAP